MSKTDTVETPVSQVFLHTRITSYAYVLAYVHILIDILEKVFLMKIFNTVIYLFGSPFFVKNCFFTLSTKFKV